MNVKDYKYKQRNAINGYLIAQNGIKMEKGFSQGTIYFLKCEKTHTSNQRF